MSNFNKAIDFVKKIKNKTNILSIVLFGSVATADATDESDIDIAVIYDKKNQKNVEEIDAQKNDTIQTIHLSLDELKSEIELQNALAGDGILLYGSPVSISIHENILKPKMILIYDTTELDQKVRNNLHRALYGGKSISEYKGKKYESVFVGAVSKLNVKKLSRGVLYCDKKNAFTIIKIFKNLNVRWREISVWTYE